MIKPVGLRYDPRVKLLLVLLTSTLAFSLGGGVTGALLFGIVLLFALLAGIWKDALAYAAVYVLLFLLAQVVPAHLASVIQFFFLRMLTIALGLSLLFQTTEISELISSLRSSHVPQVAIIPFAVALRFLPSIMQDAIYIKQGLKTRGVGLSLRRVLAHPAQTYEAFIVPILMRVLMTATELSASAETRGISYPCEKTQYQIAEFGPRDGLLVALMTALFALVVGVSLSMH